MLTVLDARGARGDSVCVVFLEFRELQDGDRPTPPYALLCTSTLLKTTLGAGSAGSGLLKGKDLTGVGSLFAVRGAASRRPPQWEYRRGVPSSGAPRSYLITVHPKCGWAGGCWASKSALLTPANLVRPTPRISGAFPREHTGRSIASNPQGSQAGFSLHSHSTRTGTNYL